MANENTHKSVLISYPKHDIFFTEVIIVCFRVAIHFTDKITGQHWRSSCDERQFINRGMIYGNDD